MSDWPHALHAYLHGPDSKAIVAWLREQIPDLELRPISESEGIDDPSFSTYRGSDHAVVLEEHRDVGWFGLDLLSTKEAEIFAGWDNVRLGTTLVDALGGEALVDGGEEYAHPGSAYFVRVTRQTLDLVLCDGPIGEPIDERWTRPIARRDA